MKNYLGVVYVAFYMYVYVQRIVRIGTIPELYLRIVRIPTLSADSGIVPDNKGYFIDFCYNQALRKVGMDWTKRELGEYAWESIFTLAVCREVFSHFQTRIYSDGSHFKHKIYFVCTVCMFCITGIILYVTI